LPGIPAIRDCLFWMMEGIACLHEGHVRHDCLDFTNDFWFCSRVERFNLDVEYGLRLWFLLRTGKS
jgi:hypothetical protein